MDLAVRGMNFDLCLVYLDDIVVFSKTLEEHTRRLELLFERHRLANLKLKPSKCHLMQTEIAFLGHVVSKDGVSTDPAKIEALKNWPVPTSITEVRSFLGSASYYMGYNVLLSEIRRLVCTKSYSLVPVGRKKLTIRVDGQV